MGLAQTALSLASGGYVLVMALDQPATLGVGRLGQFLFGAGSYLYVGRARRGLGARLARHLRREKRLRWHIDYLLQVACIEEIWVATYASECAWARALACLPAARIPVAGFGASDCRCPGHLVYLPQRPRPADLRRLLPGARQLR